MNMLESSHRCSQSQVLWRLEQSAEKHRGIIRKKEALFIYWLTVFCYFSDCIIVAGALSQSRGSFEVCRAILSQYSWTMFRFPVTVMKEDTKLWQRWSLSLMQTQCHHLGGFVFPFKYLLAVSFTSEPTLSSSFIDWSDLVWKWTNIQLVMCPFCFPDYVTCRRS